MQSYRNKTHQRRKIYKQSPRPEERWARQLECWDEKMKLIDLSWFVNWDPKTQFRSQLTFWGVCCDGIEDVDEDKEEGDKKSHPTLRNQIILLLLIQNTLWFFLKV